MANKRLISFRMPEMTESEALKRARARAKDVAQGLEELNGRPLSKRKRKLFIREFEGTVLSFFAEHFAFVHVTDDKVRKNPR